MNKLRLAAAFGLLCVMGLAQANDLNTSQGAAYPGKWVPSISQYGQWERTGDAYSCEEWQPLPSTVKKGASFEQVANCSQNFQRTVGMTMVNDRTGIARDAGLTQTEVKTDTVKYTRLSKGTREND